MRREDQDAVNFMLRIPDSALETIQQTIMDNLRPVRKQFQTQAESMQNEVLNLKNQITTANEDKLKAERDIETIRGEITNHRVLDEVRQKELEMLLFKNYPKRHKLTEKTTIQAPKERLFEFPKRMKPFDGYNWPDPVFEHNLKSNKPLYTQSEQLDVQVEKGVLYDHFASYKMDEILRDPKADRKFMGKANQGVKLPADKFPN